MQLINLAFAVIRTGKDTAFCVSCCAFTIGPQAGLGQPASPQAGLMAG